MCSLRRVVGFVTVVFALLLQVTQSPGAALAPNVHSQPAERVSGWQPEVEPIARAVERLRGERFTKAVRVEFLSDTEFDQRVAAFLPRAEPSDRAFEVGAGLLRALGYTDQTNEELRSVPESVNVEALGALYDPRSARILTRRSRPRVLGDVFLAHELTHALDDQIADLKALAADVSSAADAFVLTALVEGDATYIMRAYLETLSLEDQASFFNEQQQFAAIARERLTNLPPIVLANSVLPYTVGQWLPALVAAKGGGHAISKVFDHLPRYGIQFFDPTTYLARIHARTLRPPAAKAGEKRIRGTQFGASSLFLLLSSRIDPRIAFAAAEGWRGGALTVLSRDGLICTRLAFTGRDAAGTTAIGAAFDQWLSTMPARALATSAKGADEVTVAACDPGEAANAPTMDPDAALGVPPVRNALLIRAVIEQRASLRDATCAADSTVADPGVTAAIVQGHLAGLFIIPPDVLDTYAAGLADAVAVCHNTNR